MVMPLVADASTRRYYRVQWSQPGTHPIDSCIIMDWEPWKVDETPDFLTVAEHLKGCGVRVPEIYGVEPSGGWMALEDFGDVQLAVQWQVSSGVERLRWGREAMRALVTMHTIGTDSLRPSCPTYHLAFDVQKLLSELKFFRQHALEGLRGYTLTADEQAAFEIACHPLCEWLSAQPRFFCHRDYHGWNLMAHDEMLGVLDFQDARMGPQAYDVVSLLTDRGTPDLLGTEVTAALIESYLQQFESVSGYYLDRSEFTKEFDFTAIQRCLKAIGSFAFMIVAHRRWEYNQYIAPTWAYLQPLLQRYDSVSQLNAWLQAHPPIASVV